MLHKFTQVVEGMSVYPTAMMANVIKTKGLIFSQRVLIALMEKGLSRPKAYDFVQRCAMKTWQEGIDFRSTLLMDKDMVRYLTAEELDEIFDLNYYLRNVKTIFRKVGL
jgi:adenylosuccinate lyase